MRNKANRSIVAILCAVVVTTGINLGCTESQKSSPTQTRVESLSANQSVSTTETHTKTERPSPDQAVPKTQTRTESPSSVQPAPTNRVSTRTDTNNITVYVTRTGECYHRGSCGYLRRSKIPMNLSDAKRQYRACSRCRPPQ